MQRSKEEVAAIAAGQKMLLWTILLSLCVNIGSIALQGALAQQQRANPAAAMLGLGILAVALAILALQIASVVRLCLALKEGWATALYVIFQFVPCINLILLLFLNGRATSRLKECGIRVGLMGANSADLANYQPQGRACESCGEPLDATAKTCPVCGARV